MSSSNDIEIKKATFSMDKTLVDQNNLEIPPNSIIHCLGSLFQVTDQGLKHVVGKKIDSETYFADSDLYFQMLKNPKKKHQDYFPLQNQRLIMSTMRILGILTKIN